jgi:di/tricarboxylate transporter
MTNPRGANLLVNAIAISYGMKGFSLFEFAPLGLVMCVVGVVYLLTVGHWLLPRRKGDVQHTDKYRLADYMAEIRVGSKSPLIGETWEKSEASKQEDVRLIKLVRNSKATWKPAKTRMREGDILLVHGNVDRIIALQQKFSLEGADVTLSDKTLSSEKVKLVEALVPPRSRLVGRTLRKAQFARRYGLTALAVQRRGKILRERLADTHLIAGDTFLLQGDKEDVSRLMKKNDLIVTNELTELFLRKDRVIVAVILLLGVLTLAALNAISILVAAILGAVCMVLTRCLTIEEAYESIDWQIIFLLGGIIPLGLAMEYSGAASWVVTNLLAPFSNFGPVVILAILYLTTALLTETMSNNAAAILLAPFAISFATTLNVSARPFLVAITFAASTSFATPIGYQTNTMIYAAGGYKFSDYTRVGAPLNLVFLGIAVLLIPVLWPF